MTRITGAANRFAGPVTWVSWLLIAVAVVVAVRALPIDRGIDSLRRLIEGAGVWGPAVFGLVYVVAVVLFVPASPLTLAGGAAFGLGTGLVTVSIASTTGAACAFLISRYIARRKVAEMLEHRPRLKAIDTAIRRRGWKIVALLRLTPAPFAISNYVFGVTPVRFLPYVGASWAFMLPATFLYVYLGYLGGAALAAAADGGQSTTSVWVWVARVTGLAATLVVTLYVTRIALNAIRQDTADPVDEPVEPAQPLGWPRNATAAATAAVAAALLVVAGGLHVNRDAIRSRFGPPRVVLAEAYEEDPASPAFDHARLDELLARHVDRDGRVDYRGLAADAGALDAYLKAVAEAPFDALGRNEKLALLINAYNAFTLRLILDYAPVKSIKDIPAGKRWDDRRWIVGGNVWSLNQIEHEQIRPKFNEPQIHFALVCAAVGCPPLRTEAYSARRLDSQLDAQSRYVHEHPLWLRMDEDRGTVHLTRLYDWYAADFEQAAGSVLAFAARYSEPLKQAMAKGDPPAIRWLDYDWALNAR